MSGSSQTTDTHQTVAPWGPQAASLQNLLSKSDAAVDQSQAISPYTGDMVSQVGTSGNNALMSMLNGSYQGQGTSSTLQGGGLGAFGGGIDNTRAAMSGLQGFSGQTQNQYAANTAQAAQQYMDPSIINNQTQAAMRSANQNFNENIMPTLANNAAASGNGLSTHQGIAQGIAERGLNQTAADTSSNLTANAYNQGINAAQAGNQQQLSALSQYGSFGQGLSSLGASAASAGISDAATNANMVQGINQSQIGYDQNALTNALDMNNYARTQMFQPLDMYSALVNNRSMGTQTDGTSTQTNNPSMMSTIGSGLGAIGGIMGKCDRDHKTDIKQIAQTEAGLPIYIFRYKNDNERKLYIGLMADDVEAIDPSMVIDINGIKHIRANDFYKTL